MMMMMVVMGSLVVSIKTHQLEHRSLYPQHLIVTSKQLHKLLYMSLDSRAVFLRVTMRADENGPQNSIKAPLRQTNQAAESKDWNKEESPLF